MKPSLGSHYRLASTGVIVALGLLGFAPRANAGTVSGTVKDSVTNAGLSGVLVKVNQQSGKQATSGTSGTYSIASVTAGTVTLNASKAGYFTQDTGNVVVPASGTVTAPTILLVKMGTITGKVVNVTGGAAVASATVTVTGTSNSTTTDTSGNFTLFQPTGSVTLTVTKSGWVTKVTGSLSVTNNQTTAAGNIQLTQNGTLSGTVVNALGGAAVSGATVTASPGGATATTNSSGAFSFSIAPGSYTLTVTNSGWISKTTSSYTVTASTTTSTGNITLSQSAIAGKVVNASGGAAVASATVTITGTSNSATTDASGNFTLSLAPATVTLTISKSGWQNKVTGNLTATGGQTTNAGNITLAQNGTLSGTVVNALGGAAVSGATVTASPGGATATTNSSGAFSFSIAPGSYTLTVTNSGWISKTTSSYTVTANTTTSTGNITLSQSAITGKVVNASGGAAVASATVTVTGTSNSTTTDASGNFTLSLAPATVTLTVTKTGWQNTVTGNLTATGGQTTNAGNINLSQAGTLSGKVVNALGGTAVSSATVTASPGGATATTNSTGDFSLSLAAGSYTLAITKTGWITSNSTSYTVTGGQTTATGSITLSQSAITGKVVNALGGAAVASATVTVTGTSNAATTDASGNFTLSLAPATVTLTISKSGWQTVVTGSLTATGGQTTSAGNIQLAQAGVLSGKIVNALGGAAVSGAMVTASPGGVSATTDSSGNFSLSLAAGNYALSITMSGWITKTTAAYSVTVGQTTSTGNVSMSQSAISGKVVAAAGGAAVANATVTVTGTSNAVTTDAGGNFTLSLAPATVTLTVTKAGWRDLVSGNVTAVGGQTTNAGNLVLTEVATVTGSVKDSATGNGINGATVTLHGDPTISATTSITGTFLLTHVPVGTQSLDVVAAGYQQKTTASFVVAPGTNPIGDVVLGSSFGAITGTTRDSSTGLPLSDALVCTNDEPGQCTYSDYDGAFTLLNVPVGTHTLDLKRDNFSEATSAAVVVSSGQSIGATGLGLTPLTCNISGHIYDEYTSAPVAGARAVLARSGASATTGGDGAFSFTGISAGYELLVVSAVGYRSYTTNEIFLDPGNTVEGFDPRIAPRNPDLADGIIQGRVTDSAGVAVVGATVTVVGMTSVESATDGSYLIPVPSGDYVIRAEKNGYRTVLSRRLGGSGYFPTFFEVRQNFALPAAAATGTLQLTTIEPVSRTPGAGSRSLRGVLGWYPVRTPAGGVRTIAGVPAGMLFDDRGYPFQIPEGGTLSLSLDGSPVVPGSSPSWAAAGVVTRALSHTPIIGASVLLENPSASFATTRTTDINGRFSFANGPVGDYTVTATSAGLPPFGPWTFNAGDDGGLRGVAQFEMRDPVEDGTLSISSPVSGATLDSGTWTVHVAASLPIPDDFVLNAWVDVPGCEAGKPVPAYQADGRTFSVGIDVACPSGPLDVTVRALTRYGAVLTASRSITVANPPRISSLDLGAQHILGGLIAMGAVRLVEPAPSGGAVITLASDSPTAVVPATVRVTAGSLEQTFRTTTNPVPAMTAVHVTASNPLGSQSQTLVVEPASQTSTFSGHLYQPGTQTPIPGAVLTLARTGQTVTTDASGAFTLENLAPGWDIVALAGDDLRHEATNEFYVNGGEVVTDLRFEPTAADPAMPGGVLHGTVRDSAGAPIAGATVTAPGLASAQTGADGTYQIAAPAGAYVLRAEKEGYQVQLSRRHQGAGYFRSAWEIWQDFTLPAVGATGTVEVKTIEPVSRIPGPGGVWLRSLFGAFPIETPPDGRRVVAGIPAGILFDVRGYPLELAAGGTFAVSVDGSAVIPGAAPSWAAAGVVRRTASHAPVSGANILLQNVAESFTATVTTDENGRFSFFGGPLGDYTVTGSAANLPSFGPWPFNAANDGGLRGVAQFDVRDPAEDGSLSVASPAPGATLASSTWTVSGAAALPIPGDYIINLSVDVPGCALGALTPSYPLGGRRFSVAVPASCLSGARMITVSVVTRNDSVLTATVPVTVQNPPAVQQIGFGAASTLGGDPVDGWVTLAEAAPEGGMAVTLSSDRPDIAAVPTDVLIPQGGNSGVFAVATLPVTGLEQARITASVGLSTASAPLQLRPNTVQQLTLGSTSVLGGSSTSGLVRVGEPAPAAGSVVVLSSSQPAVASVPATVTVSRGQTTAGFTLTTASVPSEAASNISASIGSTSSSQTIVVRPPIPAGEIGDGSAALWAAIATDAAAASLADDSSRVAIGSSSLRLSSSSLAETGWAFPGSGALHWDLSGRAFLSFWLYVPSGGPAHVVAQPVVVLTCTGGSYRLEPASSLIMTDSWHRYDVPILPAESQWTRTTSGSPSLTDLLRVEILLRPQSAGLTAWLDGVGFASALDGDLAEGNAVGWGTFASDSASSSVVDSSADVRSGVQGLRFNTASGFDSGLAFPADGLARWGLSEADSLSFWITPTNINYYGFQGNQPIVVLKTSSGSYRYEPAGTLMASGVSRLYQIPLAGGGPWTRTATGTPNLQDTNQLELHFDTWNTGYALSVDGVTFGKALPWLMVSPRTVVAGQGAVGTIHLGRPAPAEGEVLALTSTESAVTVPASVAIPAGATAATFPISSSFVPSDTIAHISWVWSDESSESLLTVKAPPGSITGRVVSATSGQPVPGVSVVLSGGGGSGLTDASGAFRISCAAATYTMSLTKAGWVTGTGGPVTVTPGQTLDAGSLPLSEYGTLTGIVVSSVGSQPVPGATVTMPCGPGTRTTDAAGEFSFSCPPGTYTATISKTSWVTRSVGPTTIVSGQPTSAGTIALTEFGYLSGVIVSAATGLPISGASILLTPYCGSATTNATGAFSIACAAYTYTAQVSKNQFLSRAIGPYVLASGNTTSTGTLTLTGYGTVTGTVKRATDGSVVAGALITSGLSSVSSDSLGRFALWLEPGTVALTVQKTGMSRVVTGSIAVQSEVTTDLGDILLSDPGTITGSVTNQLTGAPVAGATLAEIGTSISTTTDSAGRFALAGVSAPSTSLRVSATGFATSTKAVAPVSGQTTDVGTIALAPYGNVAGVVMSRGGLRLSGVSVSAAGGGTASTNSSGEYTVQAPPGDALLTFSRSGFRSEKLTVPVASGQTTNAPTVQMTSLVSVRGKAVDPNGNPVAGATYRSLSMPEYQCVTSSTGDFSFEVLEGEHDMEWGKTGFRRKLELAKVIYRPTWETYLNLGNVRLTPGPGTELGGSLRAPFTLDQAGGPWQLSTLSVELGATLTIEPAVTARFENGATLTVKGALLAAGTADSSILLARLENSPPSTYWLADLEATNTSTVTWARFEGARVSMKGGTVRFSHITATQSPNSAFVLWNPTGPVLRNSNLSGNLAGASCSGGPTPKTDLRLNYWGAPDGPSGSGPGTGDPVGPCVDFEPWLMSVPGSGHEFTTGTIRNATFSPGDGTWAHLSFSTNASATWSVSVLDGSSAVIRTFAGTGSAGVVDWDGKDGSGNVVPDGQYYFEASSSSADGAAPHLKGRVWKTSSRSLTVGGLTAAPTLFSPNGDGVNDTTSFSASVSYPDATWSLAFKNVGGTTVRLLSGTGAVSATWDGRDSNGAFVADGLYTAVVTVTNDLAWATQTTQVEVDATAPAATITDPLQGLISNLYRNGGTTVDVVGAVTDAHFTSWALDIGAGSAPTIWTSLASGTSPVASGTLGTWEEGDLPNGDYTLRLRASDAAGNTATTVRLVTLANIKIAPSATTLNAAAGGTVTFSSILPIPVTETIEIRDEANAFVRRLVTGAARGAGTFADPWDGKGETGAPLRDGQYRWVAAFTDGSHSLTIDLSAQMQTGYQLSAHPGYAEWDPFNNKPLTFTHTFDSPGRIGMVFTRGNWLWFWSCDPPNFCKWIDEVQPAGTQALEWAGVDDRGAYRPDIRGVYVFSNRVELSKNCIVVYGGRPKVSGVRVTPPFFEPERGPQQVTFQLAAPADRALSATIQFQNQESLSVLRTVTLTGIQPGTVTASWDGHADNGLPLAPGAYTVTVRVTDSQGHAVEGQILTTIEY